MKYCERYAALLDLFVDGELPPEEMERVRAHIAACPGCRAYVDDALAIRAGFPDAEDTAVPEGFAGGVMERIRRDAERKRKAAELKRRSLRRWAGTFGALAACCALVILVRTGSGGLKRAGSGSAAVATAGADAPAVYDMDGGAVENGIAPQAAMEEAQDTGGAMLEEPETAGERMETRMAAAAGGEAMDRDAAKMASTFDCEGSPAAAAPAAEAAAPAETAEAAPEAVNDAAGGEEAVLCLTAGEAGDLLDGFTPVWEDSVSSRYELNAEEYRALLEALERPEEPRETGEGTFTVVVKWALE